MERKILSVNAANLGVLVMDKKISEILAEQFKKIKMSPTTDIKEVMKWLIEDKLVFYRPVHPGIPDSEAGEWLAVDPNEPQLKEDYEYTYKEQNPKKVRIEFEVPFNYQLNPVSIRSLLCDDHFLLTHMTLEG